jgi:lipopolysaccharide transport system permease protein
VSRHQDGAVLTAGSSDGPLVDEVIIEAGQGLRDYWTDLWRYRELFYFLAWRDLAVRYKQTVIGVVWSVIQPVSTMIVFTIVFGRLAGLPSNGDPYAVLVFAGLLPWQFFANSLSGASASLISNAPMISKIYFPRLALPVAAEIVSFADLLISFAVLLILMFALGVPLTLKMLTLPAFVLLAAAAALGAGVWTGALNVRYRDFRYVVPFAVQLGLYISPVGFSSSVVPPQWQLLYSLNPMVGVIDGFRWAILPSSPPIYLPGLALSILIVTVLLGTGLWYFRSTERTFADVI